MDDLAREVGAQAASLDLTADHAQLDTALFRDQVKPADRKRADAHEADLARRDETARKALAQLVLDPKTAATLFGWLRARLQPASHQATLTRFGWTALQAATALRLIQYRMLEGLPIQTELHGSHDEWAGETLRRLFATTDRWSEVWAFFSDRVGMGPATIRQTAVAVADVTLGPITMRDLVMRVPGVLGPQGSDPDNHHQKYFFVKFLDPSDFPAFAYVGFHPEEVGKLGKSPEAFKAYVADLLWQDRQALEAFHALVQNRVTSAEAFQELKTAYKTWAIAQAQADWSSDAESAELARVVAPAQRDHLRANLARQRTVRRRLVRLMHRIDYEDGQAILIPTPTIHGIAGLSIQTHPDIDGNYYPKDELWLYKAVYDAQGHRIGWVLAEPQRLFDKTESGADFFTPFAWSEHRLGFRKAISQEHLGAFVALMDATPRPRETYLRQAEPMASACGATSGDARWYRSVEDPKVWPFFLARELQVAASGGSTTTPLPHHSFAELHVTQGSVQITLARQGVEPVTALVTPRQPVLLPAGSPYETITYRATGPATLLFFTRHHAETAGGPS